MKKVLVMGNENEAHIRAFGAHGIDCVFCNAASTDEKAISEAARGCQAILFTSTRFTESLFAALPDVKIISRSGIGVDTVDLEAASRHGVIVCNSANYGTYDVAQHAVALLLSLIHSIPSYDKGIKEQNDWSAQGIPFAFRMREKKLGIIGFGRISKWICRMLSGFGMEIMVYDPYANLQACEELGVKAVTLEQLLAQSDIISVNAPLTKETYHLVNDETIAAMKEGVLLVNTSRGALICQDALIRGLESGKVAGAALDVFEEEPFAEECKLRSLPNVVLTPHVAWRSTEAVRDLFEEVTGNIIDYFDGKPLRNALNLGDIRE